MHKYYFSMLLVRVVLPAGLLLSIALRPFGLSLLYLLLYLLAPLTQIPDSQTFSGWGGKYLLLNVVVSFLLLLCHAVWHSVLAAFTPYGSLLNDYPIIRDIGHNLGLVSYDGIEALMAIHYLAPELVMTGSSLVVYILVRKLSNVPDPELQKKDFKHQRYPLLTSAGKYLCLFLIMFSGIMRPSVTSGIYFLVFMGAATAWAVGRPLEKGFAVVGRCLMAIMATHIMVLLIYQCSWLIELYPPEMDFARYFGLTKLVIITEKNPMGFIYEVTDDHMWATLASPLVILVTYYVLAIETRELFKPKAKKKSALTGVEGGKLNGSLVRGVSFHRGSRRGARDKWMNATKKVRLMRNISPNKRWSSMRSGSVTRQLHQDSTGSVVVPDEESIIEEEEPTLLDDIIAAIIDFFQVLIRSSYIATTITMMAWSIMFHSWLTFVFLMWANIVWLCQDQRSFMLKTSPILVCYAMLLLLAQYIYGMNLLESELPSNITEVNLRQIGVGRAEGEPCVPLLIKALFTCMFWVTLRQRVQEIRQRRQSAVITDMAAPLQLTVSTAASVLEAQREEESRSRLLRALGEWLRAMCARYWIYVVVIMLFVIGITGDRMTIFRIIYMFLFLGFILMFQISWYWWRRLMYVFWITVIIYSMINLILIYVYQFDNFSKTIEEYLLINERLQHDLGLEPYHPADLFVKLLTPTLFLIITIMQVHYFHKDFMALSDPKTRTNSVVKEPESSRPSQAGISTMKDDLPQLPLEEEQPPSVEGSMTEVEHSLEMSSVNNGARRSIHRKASRSRSYAPTVTERASSGLRAALADALSAARRALRHWTDKVFVYLDIHLIKIIFLSLMLLCVMNVCAMHVPIMIIISPALWFSSRKQRICVLFISTLISVYFMAKMVYQIDYIKHSLFEVNCTSVEANETSTNIVTNTYNNAEWIGFHKATREKPLVVLLKGYIGLIAVFTFYSLVTYRQQTIRELEMTPKEREKVMFPDITRKDADKDLIHCIKYLVNYGFYKFGVEVTLICLIGVIGSRMDVYAVLYAAWLLALVAARRARQARLWPAFACFVTFFVPVQYMVAVGFLPQLCVSYPWSGDSSRMKHIRTWLFLPYAEEPPHAIKLIFDYFLLLFATRQLRVFRLEKAHGAEYPGGSNSEDIGKDWETPNFVNPVPDFLGCVTTWLDVVKRMVFLGMLWVTLAIMFMTGTNRVNLFSMGYLIGSFIFLWQGTDFYLRPKEAILQWWSWLLRYNVSVVVVKSLLQIPGCLFISVLQEHACWLVQLLGIGCVDKFAGGNIARFIKMNYEKDPICSVPQEDIGLAWDGVCFAFLILQRRLFHSYYFFRVIDESKATTVLASRGAELIEELRQKQMLVQEEQEKKILEKIKVKMERIKANQKKIQGVISKEPPHHDIEEDEESPGGQSEQVPLVRGDSDTSGRGYHTPDSPASQRGFHTPLSEPSAPPSRSPTPSPLPLPAALPAPGPPSPSSALMTVSLEAYLEPRRISFESPPSSELNPRARSPEESYPVFSPPPVRRRHTVASPSVLQRTSLISQSSRAEPHSHHTSIRSGDYYMFDEFDDTDIHMKDDESSSDEDAPKEMGFGKVRRKQSQGEIVQEGDVKPALGEREGDPPGSDIDDYAPLPEQETAFEKLKRFMETAWAFISSFLVSVTRYLMRYSRDYRYVSRTLSVEKKILKEKEGFGIGLREGSQMIWEPLPEALIHQPRIEVDNLDKNLLAPDVEMGKDVTTLEEQDDSMFKQDRSPFLHLTYALWYAVLAHTDIVCYIMVFINQIQSATILSIPLPLMVFLWGTLTIPRPTKTFWVTLIAYTEVIVLIKSMFQFEILPWNRDNVPANVPFSTARVIGIERKPNYAIYDLLLLLIIFLHRFMLKSLGLWKESSPEIELREDMEYALTPEDTQLVVEGRAAEVARKFVQLHDRSGPREGEDDNGSNRSIGEGVRLQEQRDYEEAGPSKPIDDDHYNVNDDQEPIIAVTTTMEDTYKHYPKVMLLSVKRYLRPTQRFFKRMLTPGARVTADVYAYMFLCDFFNFLVVIFGFAAFGTHQGDGGVQAYIEENKVPIPFLIMLILQFILIIIDRALYLRKYMLGKILFQYALIIGVHIWMFFVLPFITERSFNTLPPPPMWYMMKCIYLLLSAYQIRCGYPRRIIGNFLCKSYRFLNMICFRGFMAVPFVFELRTLMDWIWTDTSMTLMDWLKMEDIFASVFLLKCSRYVEDEFPQPRGVKKSSTSKYLLGGCVLAFVIAIIWFPLVFFAFGNSVGEPNPPTDVTVKIRIGPYLPVYQMSAQSHNIEGFTEQDYTQLSNMYGRNRAAQTFLSNYMYNDIAVIYINPISTMNWVISPPELKRLEMEALSNASLQVKFTYVITHPTNAVPSPPTLEDQREVTLPAFVEGRANPDRGLLTDMLNGTAPADAWFNVSTLFPKFIKVFNKGTTKPASQLMPPDDDPDARQYRDVQLRLERQDSNMYWRVRERCATGDSLASLPLNNCDMLVMYTFNDKLFPETLNFISGSGIIGLYTTFVFLASRILRGFFSGIYTKIMFDDLPNVDRVLQLCLDIYLVREALELSLEEDLFAKLVFLYRSPETMIKWSRPKEEPEEQRALPPSRSERS
ncbi:piezo-type mechanosensitive ion channel component isoform X3 [Bombyx mandarina]|uniref:Piezo-type mechanosensitive ion channel component isoform X3 n=1 Tax=Bombyx mandarina TaxID=7092 RepID=A0A6J2JRQ9_BOMMA|nr:piezo-type mechanosensitive ion channel component isoform X3 [Bombyx mandarina]